MIWHQYGISTRIPWASFCRESPVVGSHVIMSVFSGYVVVGFNQRKARLTAGSTFPTAFHCRFPLRFGFKGIFCPWLLSEVILGVANSKTADNTCPPGLTFWFVCLFVLLKGETYLGIKNIIQVLRMTQCLDRGVERGGGVEAPLSRKLSNFKNCLRYM